ncbi:MULTISPECIES: Hint domain-containing protein [Acetobacter]|uniref:Hint domain-containing protein n=1 Tax=Acetobacter TaxID=434 RepID=UPI0020A55F6E|nr:Hint domain-containing protein [Acetobacter indonesiensis]MCP1232135.1 Hint domain-containing protein [Acetobacter indonesiensis]
MTAALVKISLGVATVYSSGDLSALAGVSGLSSIVVTKNADTPAGDPVVVDLSTPIAGVNALNAITVENGATAKVGGGLLNATVISALKTDGGILDLQGTLVGVSALKQVYVGPSGGQITMEPTGLDVGLLSVPVIFLDKAGLPTTTIPKDFVMDFPQVSKPLFGDKSVTASYSTVTNTTTIGPGLSVGGIVNVGRVMVLNGDPFDIKNTGTDNGFGYFTKKFTQDDGKGGIITCFLPGSMIRTTVGEVAVEDVQIGDEVLAFDWRNNTDIVRPVVWVGKAHVKVQHGLPDDEAGWPVRILKDAIADGVPYKDMLITSEHCLFFKDRFVPVRMLVNGVSIFYDKSISSYDYYHVETEQHSVITADGMLTESYLDTGNRSSFRQEGKIATLRGAVKSWEDDAGAPLGVERSFVEPLFRAIEWREDKVSKEQVPAAVELTNDPDLHLVTETGAVIRPMRHTSKEYSFMLPPGTQSVHIVSRASRPSDVIGPFVDDRRYMGVAVGAVRLLSAKRPVEITSHLTTEKPQGWHSDMEWQGTAWTDGNATLPLGDLLKHGKMGILSVSVLAAGPYLKNEKKTVTLTVRSA